jgi:hypothetical protein
MKRSGMRWRQAGGQAILTLRALHQSERFARAWKWLSSTYQRIVGIPENVVLFPLNEQCIEVSVSELHPNVMLRNLTIIAWIIIGAPWDGYSNSIGRGIGLA